MANDYVAMQSRIANELSRSDLTSQIKLAIQSAIKHYERYHFWFNEKTATFNTASGTEYYAFSSAASDLVELDSVAITVSGNKYPLRQVDQGYLDSVSSTTTLTGYPTVFSVYKESFRLYPIPNGTYTVTLSYACKLSALSADADTNAWMVAGEELIRMRAKADLMANVLRDYEGASYMKIGENGALSGIETESFLKTSTGSLKPTYF